MDWHDLTPRARFDLAHEILASLDGDLAHFAHFEGDAPHLRRDQSRRKYSSIFLAKIACEELFWRTRRRNFVDLEIYGEAAWAVLLDLFVNHVHRKNISIMSACIASEVPPTTALRYISMLESEGMITSEYSQTDQRVRWLKLTYLGFESVERYLIAKAEHFYPANTDQEGGTVLAAAFTR